MPGMQTISDFTNLRYSSVITLPRLPLSILAVVVSRIIILSINL